MLLRPSSQFEGRLGAGGGFEKQVYLRQAPQSRCLLLSLAADLHGLVGLVEKGGYILMGKPLYA